MGLPIYIEDTRDISNSNFPSLHTGLLYNSVLFLCIVIAIIGIFIFISIIEGIHKLYGCINK